MSGLSGRPKTLPKRDLPVEITDGLDLVPGLQRYGAESKAQGDGKHDGEQRYPHGVASSFAQSGAREVWTGERAAKNSVPNNF
jgi:hypothetical protein